MGEVPSPEHCKDTLTFLSQARGASKCNPQELGKNYSQMMKVSENRADTDLHSMFWIETIDLDPERERERAFCLVK